tara:strand:+ start:3908 stop:4798 length:891 start_codon:yes stop_codon:yes gene_type:complete
MASVQMSGTLKEQILENYKKQLQSVYEVKTDVHTVMEDVQKNITANLPDFHALFDLQKQGEKVIQTIYPQLKDYAGEYFTTEDNLWSSSIFNTYGRPKPYNLRKTETLYLVLNENRPIEDNFSFIADWQPKYKLDNYYQEREGDRISKTHSEPSENFVEGDQYFEYRLAKEMFLPMQLYGGKKHYTSADPYAPHIDRGLIISDPKVVEILKQVPITEQKVSQAVSKMRDCLDQFTTLKRFLDEFSGGLALVPDEYKQRLAKKQPRPKPVTITKQDVIPDDLKDEMAEIVFENSLLK